MDINKLIEVLTTTDSKNISGLFEFSEASYRLYCDRWKMDMIINELQRRGETFTKEDDMGIPTIVEFLRAAFYLGYEDEEAYIKQNKDGYLRNILPK